MKRLLAALVLLTLPLFAAGDVVCSGTAQTCATVPTNTNCSGITVSVVTTVCIPSSGSPVVPDSTLLTGLVSVWPLSADGSDSVGGNTLTNNNGVTFVAKGAGAPANMPATVANFVAASSQWFSYTDSSNELRLDPAVGMSGAAWVNVGAGPAYPFWVARSVGGVREYEVARVGVNASFQWSGTSKTQSMTAGAWHLVVWRATPAGGGQITIALSLDGAVFGAESAAFTPASGSGGVFQISGYGGSVADGNGRMQGQVSSTLLAARPWTNAEASCLYGAGAGAFYPFTGVCN